MSRRLMGMQELTSRLGVSRQRAHQLAQRPTFPPPLDTLAMGRVWDAAEVMAYIRQHRPTLTEAEDSQTERGPCER